MQPNNTIQEELKTLNSVLAGEPVTNVYTVPDGYFDAVPADILMAVSHKGPITKGESVPEGYFAGLADTILNRIKSGEKELGEQSQVFSSKENVYTVPEGYFETLAESISAKIPVYESTLLAGVKSINVYTVPTGYFDSLTDGIVEKLPKAAPVIQMRKTFSVFRYAVAAVLTGLIGLSIISIWNKDEQANGTGPSVVTAQADKIISTGNFDQVLSTITDDDIVHYLEISGEDVDAALVASMTDDKTLPEVSEYFTDDKALDKLLEGLTN